MLYQDVAIPAGATTASFSFDIGSKHTPGTNTNNAVAVGLYSTATVPEWTSLPIVGSKVFYNGTADVALAGQASGSFNVAAFAGTTVRFAFINAANQNGFEVIGIDNAQLMVTTPDATINAAPVPTLNEWLYLVLAGMLMALAGRVIPSSRRSD